MSRQRKRQHRTTPFVLKDDEAALLFKPDGISLLVPGGWEEDMPNARLAATIMLGLANSEWRAELARWARKMHELGQLSAEHAGLAPEPIEQPQPAKQPKPTAFLGVGHFSLRRNPHARTHTGDEVRMRRELREAINGQARRLMREGICETWPEAKLQADALTRCNAKTRKGAPCQARGLGKGGRCRFHGGASTGPRTPEGKARSLAAVREGYARWRAQQKEAA